jgi:peptide/nickel transport system ATP-binding protein
MLEAVDVSLWFPRSHAPLVSAASFCVQPSEILALVGPSGAGKSSLIRFCIGLPPHDMQWSGSLLFEGSELTGEQKSWAALRGKTFGWVPQNAATALQTATPLIAQVAAVLSKLRGWDLRTARERMSAELAEFGVDSENDLLSRRWQQLSGGQRRLILMALWLCIAPEMLFLDEPSVGLDSQRLHDLGEKLKAHCRATRSSILIATHDLEFAREVADCALRFNAGRIQEFSIADERPRRNQSRLPIDGDRAPVLQVNNLSKSYVSQSGRTDVISGLSFTVWTNRVLAIRGPTGSGKTTAVRCAVRLLEPDEGQIEFFGRDLRTLNASELRALRKRIQVVEQDAYRTVDPKWTVYKTITEGVRLYPKAESTDHGWISETFLALGLHPKMLDRNCGDLSIGEQQRVAIIRALALQPDLVILDEPNAGLDRETTNMVTDFLKAYVSVGHRGMVVVSHDEYLVNAIADTVVQLN